MACMYSRPRSATAAVEGKYSERQQKAVRRRLKSFAISRGAEALGLPEKCISGAGDSREYL